MYNYSTYKDITNKTTVKMNMKKLLNKLLVVIVMLAAGTFMTAQEVVASYDFSGNVKDKSEFSNNLTVNGTKLTADRFGNARSAISFDGKQDRAIASNAEQLNTPTTTVSFWVNMSELPAQGEIYLVSFGGWQQRYKVSVPAHGKPIWTTNAASGISDMDAGEGNQLIPGAWTHLVFSHDGTKDKIYVNGTLANEKDVAGDLNDSSFPFGIGHDPMSNSNIVNGSIDELIVFDAALTDEAVMALYEEQNTAPIVADGIVAQFSFDGNASDGSDFENHAVTNGVSYSTNRFGQGSSAAHLDGEGTITAAGSNHLNSGTTTVAFWVKMDQLAEQGEYFLMSQGGWQERWKISLPSHGKPVWTTNGEGGISDMDSGDGNELTPGQWTHLAFVHDGAKDLIYVNGSLANEKAVTGNLNNTIHPLGIGYDPIDNANFSKGSFDDVAIYNYALDASEIESLFGTQSMSGIEEGDIVANYPLNGNGKDVSVYQNNASAVNTLASDSNRHGWGGNATSGALVAYNSPVLQSDNTSISFWVKPYSFPEMGEVFILSNGGWQERWKVSLPAHGKPVFTSHATSCCSDMDTGEPIALNEWTHLVMIHDGDKDYIYVNGVLANEKEALGPLSKTSYPLGIGFDPIDGAGFFDGAIDDLKIFNKGLSAEEVTALYDLELAAPVVDGNLVAYYSFTGNSYDETEYANNASSTILGKDRFGKSNRSADLNESYEVTASNSPQLNSPQTTVGFWINPTIYPAQGEVYLISFGGWQERFKASLPSSGKVVWTTNHAGGISDMDSGENGELALNEWTYVTLVHDGSKDIIYYNGVKMAEKVVEGDLNSTLMPLGIGYNAVDGGNNLIGSMDEVQIYNVALSDEEILAIYNDQNTPPVDEDTESPSAPLDLQASVEFTNVSLSWSPSQDNVGIEAYNVFIGGTLSGSTSSTAFLVENLNPLTDYNFGVTAVDLSGNESNMTTLLVSTLEDASPDTIPPSSPINLTASPSFSSVLLSWEAATDDTKVNGYIVLLDGVFYDSLGSNTLSILVGGLEPSELYSFEVGAFDLAGNLSEYAEITVSTTEPLETAEPGLVAHYPFNNDANDATPYSNHGNIGGNPIFEEATHPLGGTNIKFDGDQDSILVPNGVQLLSEYTSISFWIRVDSINIQDAESYIIDFGHWDQRLKISLPQHLKVVFTTNSKNTQFDNFISDMDSGSGNEMVKGFWWHVTMVHDGTNDLIYVNGIEANKKPVTGVLNTTSRPLGIGSNPIDGGQYFIGGLDEVKFYNRALTVDEISKLYTDGTVGVQETYIVQQYIEDVFPNPATDKIRVFHSLPSKQNVFINVYDIAGRQLGRQELSRSEIANGFFEIDVHDYKSGIYFINVNYGGKNLGSLRFVKQ